MSDLSKRIEKYLNKAKVVNEGSEISYGNVGTGTTWSLPDDLINKIDFPLMQKYFAEMKAVSDKVTRVLKSADQGFDASGKYSEPTFEKLSNSFDDIMKVFGEFEAKVVKCCAKK